MTLEALPQQGRGGFISPLPCTLNGGNMKKIIDAIICWILFILAMTLRPAAAADMEWPGYRGANRDGISHETGLIKTFPAEGPKAEWRVNLGEGYSGIAIFRRTHLHNAKKLQLKFCKANAGQCRH